jgi:putative RecB family exonuclease
MSIELPILPAETRTRPAGVWEYISASRLNLWLKCPLAFKLKYIDGIVTPPSSSQFVGKMVHLGLERYYRQLMMGRTLETTEVVHNMDQSWEAQATAEQVAFESCEDERGARQQAQGLVNAYLAQLSNTEPRPLAVEASMGAPLVHPITGEDLGVPLVGIVDLVLDSQHGPTIVDFKTAARGGLFLDVIHELQLSAYAYLYRNSAGLTESGLEIRQLIKTKVPKVERRVHVARQERHFRRLFSVIRAYLDALDSGQFPFRPGITCGHCEFVDRECREWMG